MIDPEFHKVAAALAVRDADAAAKMAPLVEALQLGSDAAALAPAFQAAQKHMAAQMAAVLPAMRSYVVPQVMGTSILPEVAPGLRRTTRVRRLPEGHVLELVESASAPDGSSIAQVTEKGATGRWRRRRKLRRLDG